MRVGLLNLHFCYLSIEFTGVVRIIRTVLYHLNLNEASLIIL